MISTSNPVYVLVHSKDVDATEEFIFSEFSDVETGAEYLAPILTPSDVFKKIIASNMEDMAGGVIAMVVVLAVMSVCMYFIMRSSLMSRIKEVGIYRAIGVSKKNLVFKFFVESLVIACLTVLVGYIGVSAFIGVCMRISPLVSSRLYYPVWLALADLLILLSLSVVCGILPILSLLRKTPSQILAKYDI